jgi:hypothetical protein
VIDLRGHQLIQHVHGRGEQHPTVGLAGPPADDLRQKGLSGSWIPDDDDVGALGDEVQVEQAQDLVLELRPGLVMVEVKRLDADLGLKSGHAETPLDRPRPSSFQFHVGEPFDGFGMTEVLGSGTGQDLIQFPADAGQLQLFKLAGEFAHGLLRSERMKASYSSKDSGSVTRSFRVGSLSRSGGCCSRGERS